MLVTVFLLITFLRSGSILNPFSACTPLGHELPRSGTIFHLFPLPSAKRFSCISTSTIVITVPYFRRYPVTRKTRAKRSQSVSVPSPLIWSVTSPVRSKNLCTCKICFFVVRRNRFAEDNRKTWGATEVFTYCCRSMINQRRMIWSRRSVLVIRSNRFAEESSRKEQDFSYDYWGLD